ncbi:hypothetical protein OPT61_g4469 [Boeremia exigua]|uniref:Uncharacterized protein n=1 Tax=Boeremia exigua TaxID=749465 RepID=A0ACC2IE53_9PLEO|nr:hypothetical protein OPT61_g4469 [Boeremia exigua]
MGRTEKSQGLAPPAIRKDVRAKQARHIINKIVPSILSSNARARRGADGSELFTDPGPASIKHTEKTDEGSGDVAYVKRKGQGRRKAKGGQEVDDDETTLSRGKAKKSGKRRKDSIDESLSYATESLHVQPAALSPEMERTVRIVKTDSLTAAQMLVSGRSKQTKKPDNVCVLNMASLLRPGGGVLAGATSQEEFLCARTTLLPSLKEEYYRLPEFGGIFTPDVLVFRTPGPLGDSAGELGVSERYWIDVINAGMLRFPDLEGSDDEVKRLSKKDREIVQRKMRAVLRIAAAKGVKRLVLGAWGCGAYGNPVADIAQAWSSVLTASSTAGVKKGKTGPNEVWSDLQDVLFAIPNSRVANDFANAFGGGIQVEDGPNTLGEDSEDEDGDGNAEQELRSKIEEMESQMSKVWNAELKSRLGAVLDGLKVQLSEMQGHGGANQEDVSDVDSEVDEVLVDQSHGESDTRIDMQDTDSDDVDSGIILEL